MEKAPLATLERIAHAEAERRRVNRAMIQPGRHPDTGEPLPGAPNRRAATAQAAAQARARLMLQPAPVPVITEPQTPDWSRALDLCLSGLTKRQAARVLGVSTGVVDGALRRAYKDLGVHDIIAAGAAWRARAQAEGHTMNDDDERAARALSEREEDPSPEPLSPRQDEAMALLAAGVARRDLHVALCCRPGTIHTLLADTYKKLGAHNQGDAVRRYLARRGGMDQAPYERPMAANQNAVSLERGAKADGPGAVNPRPGLEIPP